MESPDKTLSALFLQLGLSDDAAFIAHFLETHRPLPGKIALSDAPFWTAAQRAFLAEELALDADWSEVIDELDVLLR